jgi:hypothetical protein
MVENADEFYRILIDILKVIGFTGSKVDLLLLINRDDNGVTLIGIYVGNCLVMCK